jgi:hypothetical protein
VHTHTDRRGDAPSGGRTGGPGGRSDELPNQPDLQLSYPSLLFGPSVAGRPGSVTNECRRRLRKSGNRVSKESHTRLLARIVYRGFRAISRPVPTPDSGYAIFLFSGKCGIGFARVSSVNAGIVYEVSRALRG